jgi:arylsulfatase A-like enzyme
MKLLTLMAVATITLLEVAHSAPVASRNRPNIIFFINDDQVKEEIGCYGGKVLTPHLDRLAREGMRFDNAHVVSTVCTPSRYSLFTGRYPGNAYCRQYLSAYPKNRHGAPGFNLGLEDDNMNVGNVLRLAGYVTGHVGKLHVGPHLKDPEEFAHYGLYDVSKKSGLLEPDAPEVIAGWRQNEKWYRQWIMDRGFSWAKHVYWGNVQGAYPHHNPEWTLEAALEFIDENHDQPFYLHYATTMMHGGPNGWNNSLENPLASGAGKLEELPAVIPSRADLRRQVEEAGLEESANGFTWMDATVGAMLDKLDQLGIADNTLFVFVTDHGTEGKFSLHDHNGTAIPCIIRWPGVVKPGSVSSNLVSATDMVPTFFDFAGVAVPEGYRLDGKSIKPILTDPRAKVHGQLYFELGYARGIRTEKWKYIAIRYGAERFGQIENASLKKLPDLLAYQGGAKNASNHLQRRAHYLEPDQLYNLTKDPLEQNNLVRHPEFKEQLKKMRALLTEKLAAQGHPCGEFVPGADSVPAEDIWPHLEKMKKLRLVKRGFEEIDVTPAEPKPRSKAERKAAREARKLKKNQK